MVVLDSSEYLGLGSWLLPRLPLTERFHIILPMRVAVAPGHTCRWRIQLPDILTSDASISLLPCWSMSVASGMVAPGLVKRRNTTWAEHPPHHHDISYNGTVLSFPMLNASWPTWLCLFSFAVQLSDRGNVSLYSSWLLLVESQWILLFPVPCSTSLMKWLQYKSQWFTE